MSKTIGMKVRNAQAALFEELAAKAGMSPSVFLRDIVTREYMDRRGIKWPEGYFEGDGTPGGERRGAGRPAKD